MLPQFLSGSYQRYKDDTTVFTTWLSRTAMTCGYKSPSLTQPASAPPKVPSDSSNGNTASACLKGKARKEAKAAGQTPKASSNNAESPQIPTVKYAVTAKDLLRQAELVAASAKPRIQMPTSVQRVVERAIDARQRCASWFQRTGCTGHFDDEIDITFDIFCFFEDLHRIQDFLKETWESYKAGKVDLITATTTTNAAVHLVRRAEEDVIATSPRAFSKPRSYEAIAVVIFFAESLRRGEDPLVKMGPSVDSLKITPFDDFLYLPTARILMKFERLAALKAAYPQPVPPIRMSYVALPELLQTPAIQRWDKEDEFLSQHLMDQWFFENIQKALTQTRETDPPVMDEISQGFWKLSREGEVSTWIVFASRVFLDIQEILGDDIVRGYKETCAAGKNVTNTLGFKTLADGRSAPFQGIGERWRTSDAVQVSRLGDLAKIWITDNPLPKMRDMWMVKMGGQVSDTFQSMDTLDPETRKYVNDQLRAKYPNFTEDPGPEVASQIKAYGPLKPIQPNKDSNFMHTHNPLLCGTLAFQLALNREQAGISLANHHVSIFVVAHLYNALRQLEVLEERWPDIEQIIDLHIKTLFAGQLPTTPKDLHSRFSLQLGVSAQSFARNQRPGQTRRPRGF